LVRRRIAGRLHAEALARVDHPERQVVADVGVHARNRELKRRYSRVVPGVEQRRPTLRNWLASHGGVEGGEEQVAEVNVQILEERRRGQVARLAVRAYGQRRIEIQ